MKNFLASVLLLILSVSAFACDPDFNPYMINNGTHNTSSVSAKGILGVSQMTGYNDPANPADNLGSVAFATGKLTSGSLVVTKLLQGAVFSSSGSSFTVVGNGTNGVPKGAVFTGSFTGDIKWQYTNAIWGVYVLVGNVKGKLVVDGKPTTIKHGNTAQGFTYANGTFTLTGGLTDLYY